MSELLKKEYIKIDDECFEIVEERRSKSTINYKLLFDNMDKYLKNYIIKVKEINQHINQIKEFCEKYNEALDDMIKAKEELGFDYEVPAKIDYDFLQAEASKTDEWEEKTAS